MKKGYDYTKDYYRGIGKLYFNRVLKTIIILGNLEKEEGLILDYGCGFNHLKKMLPNNQIIGYDIIKELSDVDDYRKLKPSIIVCNHVLEHMNSEEINNLMIKFKEMNIKKLIVGYPTDNIISQIGKFITRIDAGDSHKSTGLEIYHLINKYFSLSKQKKVFTMTDIGLWE